MCVYVHASDTVFALGLNSMSFEWIVRAGQACDCVYILPLVLVLTRVFVKGMLINI